MGMPRKPVANYEPAEVRKLHWCYSTRCPISELPDPVDLQRQLECISPPVGRPIKCMVTRTYTCLIHAYTIPGWFLDDDIICVLVHVCVHIFIITS